MQTYPTGGYHDAPGPCLFISILEHLMPDNSKILIAFDDKTNSGMDTAVEATPAEWEALQASAGSRDYVIDASAVDFNLLDALQERDPAVVSLHEFRTLKHRVALV